MNDKICNITGTYFDSPNKQVKSSKYSYQKENIEELMELTMSYLK
ncbi:MAG: hypothetical protein QCI00_00110 [Candidatus Thermoplasmatota archaeon]|nr:hypothetical protein [Candidatus Thermoplasmatota archaeon]